MFKRRSRSTSPRKEEYDSAPLPLSWEPLEGRERPKRHWGKKLAVVGGMYFSFTMVAILWDRLVDPRYDWALILVFVAVLVTFGLALKRQQRNNRKRLLHSKRM